LQGAAGALFPSLAEGYGLPPIEAAALGVPVICNDLPVYREILGDIPVYASVLDRYLWRTTINDLTKDQRAEQQTNLTRKPLITRPNWKNHFNLVLKVT
jgi:glycosyltransferase involved in cell wall biosynthesis